LARALAWIIVAYCWLTAALFSQLARLVFEPRSGLMCGNVLSDPLGFELNVMTPLACGCAGGMIRLCFHARRWPLLCTFSILLLFLTAATVLGIVRTLSIDYGLPFGRIWWLPAWPRCWLLGR
jgi:hypothetical protein